MGIPVNSEARLDALSLARCIKSIGRAYQRQAIELVKFCRIFMETFPPEKRHDAMPKLTMVAITEALRSATVAGKRQTDKASNAFQEARVKLLRYRATAHPGLQTMDAMITQRMTRAKEKDERSLELFNQIRERRGHTDTSRSPNASERLSMGHTAGQVDTEAQVACFPTAGAPSERSYAPSASTLTPIPSPTRVSVKEGQRAPPDNGHTPCSTHTLTHQASLVSISQKRPTAGSCSTATTTPVPPAPGAPGSLETRSHTSSSSTAISPAIQQSSFKPVGPRGTQSTTIPERPESVSSPPSSMPSHPLTPTLPCSPLPPTHTDPPSNTINPAPKAGPEHRNGTTQHSLNALPQSRPRKVSPIRSQTKIKSITYKPSIKFASFSIPPTSSTREAPHHHHLSSLEEQLRAIKVAPVHLTMPGALFGMSLDVDISSWVLVGPVSPVESSKTGWFKRLFSRRG